MSYIENGSRYKVIKEALLEESAVTVIDEIVSEPRVDGRTGKIYTETTFRVAPVEGTLNSEGLNKMSRGLLSNVEPVFRQNATFEDEENNSVRSIRTFDGSGRSFRPIAVEIYSSQEEALDKRG